MIDLVDFALLNFSFILQVFGMMSPLLLGFGKVCNDLIVDILLPRELLLELSLGQIAQLQLPHQFIHRIAVQELSIAYLTNLAPDLQLGIIIFVDGRWLVLCVIHHGGRSQSVTILTIGILQL